MTNNNALSHSVPADQRDLIERFEAAYNSIDKHMRKQVGRDRQTGFTQVVKEYSRTQGLSQTDVDALLEWGDLRNALIHGKVQPNRYLAVPMQYFVQEVEALMNRIVRPIRVGEMFGKQVETIAPTDSLTSVLKRVAARDYTQFPVYDGHVFKGMLTENGITRWLAQYVTNEMSIVELEDVKVRQVVRAEEPRPDCKFFARTKTVDEAKKAFADEKLLEVILVTQSGKTSESLLGIITRWDIVHL